MTKLKVQQRRYLGSKTKLLDFIETILIKENVEYETFLDLFAGTGVVGANFNHKATIYFNDILYSNYMSYIAFFSENYIDLDKIKKIIQQYNLLDSNSLEDNYMSDNFSDTYFSYENCKKIGFIREDIDEKYVKELINLREKAYLITALIYSVDRIANTVGHYDAYRKTNDLDRTFIFNELDIPDNNINCGNKFFNEDANALVKKITSDVVYIDTPYNSRQYSDSYHLLENIATWKKPEVKGIAKKMDRSHLKSAYSLKTAPQAFSDLIKNINAKYILVSYNDMGTSGHGRSQAKMSDYDILATLEKEGRVTIYETDFSQFTTGKSTDLALKERVFFCEVNKKTPSFENPSHSLKKKEENIKKKHVKSPLNYTGGKYRILNDLYKHFPKKIETFYDVFCGGANVGINGSANSIVCLDNNHRVIKLLNYLKSHNFESINQSILDVINTFDLSQSYIYGYSTYNSDSSTGLGKYNKKNYMALREYYNNGNFEDFDESIVFLTLIIYGFNNQIRFNSEGKFNMPIGKRDYNGNTRKNISRFNEIVNTKKIAFDTGDFRELLNINFQNDDFVYLDPPYILGLASYNESGGWTVSDEIDLHSILDNLNKKGVRFALSNVLEHKGEKNEHMINWLENSSYKVIPINFNYNNSNYHSKAKESTTKEVLVINY